MADKAVVCEIAKNCMTLTIKHSNPLPEGREKKRFSEFSKTSARLPRKRCKETSQKKYSKRKHRNCKIAK